MGAAGRNVGDAVVEEMFGAEDDLDDELDELDEGFGEWSSSAPSMSTWDASRAFAKAMNLSVEPAVSDPVGHWVLSYNANMDLQQAKNAATTISDRYRTRWVLIDEGPQNVRVWLFLPR